MSKQSGSPTAITKSFYNRLVVETEDERNAFLALPIIKAGLNGELPRDTYLGYLSEAFHHVKHMVPLIATVRANIPENRTALHSALADFTLEKQGNEKWILSDIRNAGGDAESVQAGEPASATEELLAFAYDFVNRVNPVGFFGMIYVIEATGSELATHTVEKLMASLGLPKNCFSYLLSHGSLDLESMDLFKVLMAQITDAEEEDAIIQMARNMYRLYGGIFKDIEAKTGFEAGR